MYQAKILQNTFNYERSLDRILLVWIQGRFFSLQASKGGKENHFGKNVTSVHSL